MRTMSKYVLNVAGEYFAIYCERMLEFPKGYMPFIVRNSIPDDRYLFTIEIKCGYEHIVDDSEILLRQRTYMWTKENKKDVYYYLFTSRYSDLAEDKKMWCIKIEKNKCILYVRDNLTDIKFMKELFDRPWLQRLFSFFLPDNKILSHGGCIAKQGRGYMVMGECGKGKSTLIELAKKQQWDVLADDRILLEFGNNKIRVYATPWNMKNPHLITNVSTDVDYILFLEHANNTSNYLEKISYENNIGMIIQQTYFPHPKNMLIAYRDLQNHFNKYRPELFNYYFIPDKSSVQMLEVK